jgi:uncharacterized membrane protein YgdD (TMEM256/DUF423 family)
MNATARHTSPEPFRLAVRRAAWKDVAVVVFLTVLLGAFVAQLARPSTPDEAARSLQARAACLADRAAC